MSAWSRRRIAIGALVALSALSVTIVGASAPVAAGPRHSVSAASAPPCPPRAVAPIPARTATERAQPTYPVRAAFYYGWGSTSTHFHPTYGSDDPCVHTDAPRRTVANMRYAGMNAGIASWAGPRSYSDVRFAADLRGADGTPFRWALYYEPAGHSAAQIRSDLYYIRDHYARDRNYLRVGGKAVLFVWAGGADNCSVLHQWVSANAGMYRLVMKNYYGAQRCPYRPSSWHAYGPASRALSVPGHSYTVSPGFWPNSSSRPLLGRDPRAFDLAVKAMVASRAPWQLVSTFDEWGENTSVESAAEWASGTHLGRYLDLLHVNLGSR